MAVASGKPEGLDWAVGARAGLQALQRLDQGSAQLSDATLTVTGSVANERTIKDVEALLQPARDARFSINVDLIPPPEWTAELADRRLTLSGRLPNESVRADIVRAAGTAGVAVEDRTELSGVETPWAPRAVAAMPNFLKFERGTIMVQGRVFRISGEGLGSVQQYLREDMTRIGDEMSVRYALQEIAPQIEEIAGLNLDATGDQKEESCQTAFERILQANTILFGTGDARISRESGETLDKLVEVARRCSEFRIGVEGHTDNVGQAGRNMTLSRARASAVMAYLTERGLPDGQMTAEGFGQTRPVGDNGTVAGRAQNRRIEFKVSAAEDR
jgi:OOP family OmpA-OmpF porin